MTLGQMRQTVFQDTNLSLFQQSINDQFSILAQIPFITGTQVTAALTSGQANTINHRLGKQATGYFVMSNTANTPIWNDTFSGSTSIVLRCSANTTVILWVF